MTTEIHVRDWQRSDVRAVGGLWLEALKETHVEGLELHADAGHRLHRWLLDRVRERSALGLVAEVGGEFVGFVLGRVGQWESSPAITRSRRIGIIDVVCVIPSRRRGGVGTALVRAILQQMKTRGAARVETNWLVSDRPASEMWSTLGFVPSLQRGWLGLDGP